MYCIIIFILELNYLFTVTYSFKLLFHWIFSKHTLKLNLSYFSPAELMGWLGRQYGWRAAAAGARRARAHPGGALRQPPEQHVSLIQGRRRLLPPGEGLTLPLISTVGEQRMRANRISALLAKT